MRLAMSSVALAGGTVMWLAAMVLAPKLALAATPGPFGGGNGTVSTPYAIATAAQLEYWDSHQSAFVNADFVLTHDINLGDYAWTPISQFNGTFDGQGHRISHLQVDSSEEPAGFIANLSGVVERASFSAVKIYGSTFVGGVAGIVGPSGVIEGCIVSGLVASDASAGVGVQPSVGGVAGVSFGALSRCTSRVTMADSPIGAEGVGGLIGFMQSGSAELCVSTAMLNAPDSTGVGGLVGRMAGGLLDDSYATGTVAGLTDVGGLVGSLWNSSTVQDSYSLTRVNASSGRAGGLIGDQYQITDVPTVLSSFWSPTLSGHLTSDGGQSLSLSQFHSVQTFDNPAVGWDFTAVWDRKTTVNDGFPYLRSERPASQWPGWAVPLIKILCIPVAVAVILLVGKAALKRRRKPE